MRPYSEGGWDLREESLRAGSWDMRMHSMELIGKRYEYRYKDIPVYVEEAADERNYWKATCPDVLGDRVIEGRPLDALLISVQDEIVSRS